jgi:hypothetical protein
LSCYDSGIRAHIPDLNGVQSDSGSRAEIFSDEKFIYDKETDIYTCPSGKKLRRKSLHMNRESIDYAASKSDCSVCDLMPQCTKNKAGRTLKRDLRQEEVDYMRGLAGTRISKNDIRTRQHLMEGSFARAKRYGFDTARWRGLWRVRIQEYLTAAIQNIRVLIKYGTHPIIAVAVARMDKAFDRKITSLFESVKKFLLNSFLLLESGVKSEMALRNS